jgi:hypothetical protein
MDEGSPLVDEPGAVIQDPAPVVELHEPVLAADAKETVVAESEGAPGVEQTESAEEETFDAAAKDESSAAIQVVEEPSEEALEPVPEAEATETAVAESEGAEGEKADEDQTKPAEKAEPADEAEPVETQALATMASLGEAVVAAAAAQKSAPVEGETTEPTDEAEDAVQKQVELVQSDETEVLKTVGNSSASVQHLVDFAETEHDQVLFSMLQVGDVMLAAGNCSNNFDSPLSSIVNNVDSPLSSMAVAASEVVPKVEGESGSASTSTPSPKKGKHAWRGSKRRQLSSTKQAPNAAQDLAMLLEIERARSGGSVVSRSDHMLFDMAWLSLVIFIGLLYSSAKLVDLSPESIEVIAHLTSLWIGMMVSMFGLNLLNKAVTRVFRPKRAGVACRRIELEAD